MESKELRVGNLVIDTISIDKVSKIRALDILNIEYYELRDKSKIWYKPIPLTEEWLIKFGFELLNDIKDAKKCTTCRMLQLKIDSKFGERKLSFINCFGETKPDWDLDIKDKINGTYSSCLRIAKIKHVHQLQNLYFALTNKELTYGN